MIISRKRLYSYGARGLLFLLGLASSLSGQTIAEKKAGLQKGGMGDLDYQTQNLLNKVNLELGLKKKALHDLYGEVAHLHEIHASAEEFQKLLTQINSLKEDIQALDDQWLETITAVGEGAGYGLWHQPETTLEQLVIDYGAQDSVYVMPPEISAIKLSINSNLPIPRASWSEMLELILNQNGVGIRQLNPFLRELYLLKQDHTSLNMITNKRQELDLFPPEARVAFILSPDPSDVRRIWFFLDKFANPKTTLVQQIGRDVLIVAQVSDVQELLKLYDFVVSHHSDISYKFIALSKVQAEEMAKILTAVFDQISASTTAAETLKEDKKGEMAKRPPTDIELGNTNGLKVIVLSGLSQALFLLGTPEEIERAEKLIRDLESQVGGARQKIIHWYTTKHSQAEELAEILERIYMLMVHERVGLETQQRQGGLQEKTSSNSNSNSNSSSNATVTSNQPTIDLTPFYMQPHLYTDPFYEGGNLAVNPAPIALVPDRDKKKPNEGRQNFIVDPKTGAIVMVVEQDILPKILEIVRKLDVPKKMVQIEVLLFERRLTDRTDYGLSLLRTGNKASHTLDAGSLTFNNIVSADGIINTLNRGVLEFTLSGLGGKNGAPFDLVYRFLLSQDDVHINANPSVMTINQTPAKIAIVEELSINTGVYEVVATNGTSMKDAFTRGQYGITMEITPTIHARTEDEEWDTDMPDYITLETDVNFDTIQSDVATGVTNRPTVIRRNIHNEVLVADGETVILGGLRSKNTQDMKDKIPYLGEIPGFGKLFSYTTMTDRSAEMFILITPRIVSDPCADIDRIKCEQVMRRPGDLPEFLYRLEKAREAERNRFLAGTLRMVLGRPSDGYYHYEGACDKRESCLPPLGAWEEYDGR